jgi:hypothetical protein
MVISSLLLLTEEDIMKHIRKKFNVKRSKKPDNSSGFY